MTPPTGPLGVSVGELSFRNPIILPSGTAGYGHELEGVIDLDRVGGFVTKAVSVAPRPGAPAPRVSEFPGGMINAVGLANPGMAAVCADHLPWLATHHRGTRRFANIIGFAVEEFPTIIERLDEAIEGKVRAAGELLVDGSLAPDGEDVVDEIALLRFEFDEFGALPGVGRLVGHLVGKLLVPGIGRPGAPGGLARLERVLEKFAFLTEGPTRGPPWTCARSRS